MSDAKIIQFPLQVKPVSKPGAADAKSLCQHPNKQRNRWEFWCADCGWYKDRSF